GEPGRLKGEEAQATNRRRERHEGKYRLHGQPAEGGEGWQRRDREGQGGDRRDARSRPLHEGADGSVPGGGLDDEPRERRREAHGHRRRLPGGGAHGNARETGLTRAARVTFRAA